MDQNIIFNKSGVTLGDLHDMSTQIQYHYQRMQQYGYSSPAKLPSPNAAFVVLLFLFTTLQ